MTTAQCKCGYNSIADHDDPTSAEPLPCENCGGWVECEFCEEPVTTTHIDYWTCGAHYWSAVDVVASREWS